jgi:aspartate/glutamate racemase
MRIFVDHETAQLAAIEAEKALAAAAAVQARHGRQCVDQSFQDEILVLAPRQVCAPPLLLIGGMGPQVGLRGFATACARFAQSRKIVLVQACSIPDRTSVVRAELAAGRTQAAAVRRELVEALTAAMQLAWQAADTPATAALIVLCNTAHHFLAEVRLPPWIRLISLIDAAARRCRGMSEVIVLSTFGTRAAGLYSRSLAAWNVRCLTPPAEAEAVLMDMVYHGVKAMDLDHALALLLPLLETLARWAPHADGLICGCTEVPLVLPLATDIRPPWPLIDPLACALTCLDAVDVAAAPGTPELI